MKQSSKRLFYTFILLVFFSSGLILIDNAVLCRAQTGTQVGGILWDNTTWTAANSPYIITSTVQVPSDVTLTIEAGVTVTTSMKPSSGYLFLLNGVILANGASNKMITFDAKGLGLFSADMSTADTFLNLDYCILENATHIWGSRYNAPSDAHFNLTHSKIQSMGNSFLNIYYPAKDVFIEYNTFANTSMAISNNASVYIRYNLFNGKTTGLNYLIRNYEKGENKLLVEYNSFINMKGTVLSLESGHPTSGMNASNNYWGTTDLYLIKSMIYDNSTDITCAASINYLPILQEPNPTTPTLEPSPSPTPTITPNATETPEQSITPAPTINVDYFHIESNSTVSAFSYNSTIPEIRFIVSGENGTIGYIKTTIAKSFMPTSNINVYLDEEPLSYDLVSSENSWTVTFTYNHSTHQVTINESATQNTSGFPDWIWQAAIAAVVTSLIVAACALIWVGKVKSDKAPKP